MAILGAESRFRKRAGEAGTTTEIRKTAAVIATDPAAFNTRSAMSEPKRNHT
jgi:hypothetical protein